jgi:hypothetical protein
VVAVGLLVRVAVGAACLTVGLGRARCFVALALGRLALVGVGIARKAIDG